ncbi:MAG: sugar phosphate nucleotidyltransferase [Candidatus Omnitrophica bacterium]|nr:sugar phosphate nucleotidyltransferase [Candidatus Omnitrophota bacterium]
MGKRELTAIIPAAGLGTRLRPFTYSRPKALLPLAGRPMIAYVLETVSSIGATRVVFIVGHLASQIALSVKDNFSGEVIFVQQKEFLGLGHAILQAEPVAKGETLIFLGDTLVEGNLRREVESGDSWLAVKEVEDPRSFGVVVNDNEGWIKGLVEKPVDPVSRQAIVGVYHLKNTQLLFDCLHHLVRENIRTRDEYQLTDAIALMVKKGEKIRAVNLEKWFDCGRVETWLATNRFFLEKYCLRVPQIQGVEFIPPVYLGPEVKVSGGKIGPYVSIGKSVQVRDSVLQNVIVDEGSILEQVVLHDSVIGREVHISHYQGRLILGDNSEVIGQPAKLT